MAPLSWSRMLAAPHLELHSLGMRDILPNAMLHRRVASPQPQSAARLSTLSSPSSHIMAAASNPLAKRQNIIAIPATYSDANTSQPPGNIVGIVFGSVAGFLFLLYLIYLCMNARGGRNEIVADEEVVVRSSRRGSRSSRRAETIEVSRSSSSSSHSSRSRPPRRSSGREIRTERIIVGERRSAPPPLARDDDIVEVIEEHSPPPPPRRQSRSSRRPESGYRSVDPEAYAGGSRPVREVIREKSSRRSSGRR